MRKKMYRNNPCPKGAFVGNKRYMSFVGLIVSTVKGMCNHVGCRKQTTALTVRGL